MMKPKSNWILVGLSVLIAVALARATRARDTVLVPQTPLTPMYVKLSTGEVVPAVLMVQSDGLNFFTTVGSTSYPVNRAAQ